MFCGISICICHCRTKRKLTRRIAEKENERRTILESYKKLESKNTNFMSRMIHAKSVSDLRQQSESQNQTVSKGPPPMVPPRPDLSTVPQRGILKPGSNSQSNLSTPDRFVKPNQGVRAKGHKRRNSFEIPLNFLGPQLHQVRFAKNLTSEIVDAMDNGCVIDYNSLDRIKGSTGSGLDYENDGQDEITNL
jgi:hypothetical protein